MKNKIQARHLSAVNNSIMSVHSHWQTPAVPRNSVNTFRQRFGELPGAMLDTGPEEVTGTIAEMYPDKPRGVTLPFTVKIREYQKATYKLQLVCSSPAEAKRFYKQSLGKSLRLQPPQVQMKPERRIGRPIMAHPDVVRAHRPKVLREEQNMAEKLKKLFRTIGTHKLAGTFRGKPMVAVITVS